MSSSAAANQRTKANASLRRGIPQTATEAEHKRLRDNYRRAARTDRRRELRATLLGLLIAVALGGWLYILAIT